MVPSFYNHLAKIQRVGFFGFMREVVGLVELERERESTEAAYCDLVQSYNVLTDDYQALQVENQKLREQLAQEQAKQAEIEETKRNFRDERLRLLQPPRPLDVFHMCNMDNWFSRFTVERGVIKMFHNRQVYPCDVILISMGELRLCDQYGYPVNLAQNYGYDALPARRYAQPLIPDGLRASRMRVLFGTESEEGFWLQSPLYAQDLLVEIRAHADETFTRERLFAWAESKDVPAGWSGRECIIDMIVPFAKLLNQSRPGGYSEYNADKVREQCYAEYVELYFRDGKWD